MAVIGVNRLESFRLGDDQFIQSIEICLCTSDDDVGICAVSAKNAGMGNLLLCIHGGSVIVLRLNTNRDFSKGVNPLRDRMNVKLKQCVLCLDNGVNGFIGSIHRARAHRSMDVNLAIGSLQTDSSSWHTERAAYDLHAIENIHIQRTIEFIRDQSFKVSIYNYFFAICQFLETRKGFIELNFIERMSHFSQPVPQRVAA